jgi:ABC-type nitrate/sulfonate/bicarbonate transport system substrate-binding protein
MKNPLIGPLLAAWACLALPGIGVAQEATVTVGMAPGIVTGAILMAEAHGYFKDVGIKVDLNNLDSSADAIALLAANRFQVVEGGVSAGYFNAFGKDLPIAMVASRVSTPGRHILMLRPDLKDVIKTPKDLKGRIIATNGPGSVSDYEIGKILEAYGLSLADVDLKIFPFPQYVIAFNNKAIDAGLLIPCGRDHQAEPRDGRGDLDQYRLGQEKPGGGEEFLRRLYARRARLLSGLSSWFDAQGNDRSHGALRHQSQPSVFRGESLACA